MSLREPFFAEFEKHKASFPFINKRALFLGTVMHSIDHCNAFWNVEDHNWFDVDDERFVNLAELCRFVLLAAVDDPPLLGALAKTALQLASPIFQERFWNVVLIPNLQGI